MTPRLAPFLDKYELRVKVEQLLLDVTYNNDLISATADEFMALIRPPFEGEPPKLAPFKDEGGKWRWGMQAGGNNENVLTSGESFASERNARRAMINAKRLMAEAEVE